MRLESQASSLNLQVLINTKKEPMMLCPFDVYCPKGANSVPYGGIKEETAEGSWELRLHVVSMP